MKRHLEGVAKLNHDNRLRKLALHELKRFVSPEHFLHRQNDPVADRELAEPLLRDHVGLDVTPRESDAALALADLATYRITSRTIWAKYQGPVTTSDLNNATEPIFNEQREIWGRYEVFRQHAYSYARVLNDAELIEHYATPTPAPEQDRAAHVVDVVPSGPVLDVVELEAVSVVKTGPKFSMTKASMLEQHKHQWRTIERDMTDASTNGLDAAKAGKRGWDENAALAWARANNKLLNPAKPAGALLHAINSMSNLPSRKHTLEG
ncbi:hypothetical protein [Rhodoferax bucti]|uniref:hypothetical protein n=1 Tax=Rhodoferax bucti TaxID=2576305 RepID=UPI001108B845|nr:hypothetical protein [Rhodoferax bucti]